MTILKTQIFVAQQYASLAVSEAHSQHRYRKWRDEFMAMARESRKNGGCPSYDVRAAREQNHWLVKAKKYEQRYLDEVAKAFQ